jgi:hypothetical protein
MSGLWLDLRCGAWRYQPVQVIAGCVDASVLDSVPIAAWYAE